MAANRRDRVVELSDGARKLKSALERDAAPSRSGKRLAWSDGSWGDWYYRLRTARNAVGGVVAWCAKTPELGNGPLDVDFSLDVHFVFADSPEEALRRLRAEVLN